MEYVDKDGRLKEQEIINDLKSGKIGLIANEGEREMEDGNAGMAIVIGPMKKRKRKEEEGEYSGEQDYRNESLGLVEME